MSNEETTSAKASNKPSHNAFHVKNLPNGKNFWNRVGIAWTNKNGSLTIQLDSIPLDGRIICQLADYPTPTE